MTSDRISPRGRPARWFEDGAGHDSEHRIQECARAIFFGFDRYNENFGRITRRAREHFENRHWRGSRRDLAERIDLYEKSIRRIVASLRRELGAQVEDRSMWRRIKQCFGERVDTFPDANFAKTFFSSVTRRIFDTIGTDPEIEFVGADLRPTTELNRPVECRTYINWGQLRSCVEQLLRDFALRISYRDITRDIERVVAGIEERAGRDLGGTDRVLQLEFIVLVFYQ